MAYLNYHPKDPSNERAPRIRLVAESDESLENLEAVKADILLDAMGLFGERNLRDLVLGDQDIEGRAYPRDVKFAPKALGQLAAFAASPLTDLPIELAVSTGVPISVRDANTGSPLEEVETKEGKIVKTTLGYYAENGRGERYQNMLTKWQGSATVEA